jgi:nucleoside-diphosphate-sugar epimerase
MKTALIVGVSGIAGGNLADLLTTEKDWTVYGVARRPGQRKNVTPIGVDLQDPDAVKAGLYGIKPTHVFLTTWLRQATEADNIRVNSAMIRNVLNAVSATGSVEHVALVTGLKHYLGPFESYAQGNLPETPLREQQERLKIENFYYAQEDEVFAAAARDGYSWNVHRPHTIIGYALGNAMNMGTTLAVYATICKELGEPMQFPGSSAQWNGLSDVTDARVLAKHLLWAATTPSAKNQAFNIVNGDNFRWKWMWQRIANWFGVEAAPLIGEGLPLERQLVDAAGVWKSIAETYGLAEPDIHVLASAWHTDADLGRPIEVITDMSKSRKLGFTEFQASEDSFFDLFTTLRKARLIP